MTTQKLHNGAWEISELVNGYLVTRTFYGYTKKESIRLFKDELKGERKVQ